MPDHTNLLSENRIHATESLLLPVFTSIVALKISSLYLQQYQCILAFSKCNSSGG